jgi:hypothetical protein
MESDLTVEEHTHRKHGQQPSTTPSVQASEDYHTILVANKILEPCVIVGITDKLGHRKHLAKCFYDRTARDLPELEVGETIRMKPLPGDHTGLCSLGTCLQRVASRSYLVDVGGSLYRSNRVDLRVAEQTTNLNTPYTHLDEQDHSPGLRLRGAELRRAN